MAKKLLALLMALVMMLGIMAGCASDEKAEDPDSSATSSSASTEKKEETKKEETKKEETKKEEPKKEETKTEEKKEEVKEESPYPGINLDSMWPVVEEGRNVEIDVGTRYSKAYEDWWTYKHFEEMSGIKINLNPIHQDAISEQKNLMLASGDLPDLMHYFGFSNADVVNYGDIQGMLLDMTPYINETLMPNFMAACKERPDVLVAMTTPSGTIYTLPRISSAANPAYMSMSYWNYEALAKMGLEVPKTIDEAIAALYQFQADDPYGVGAANMPIGGSAKHWGGITERFLLNAYGFVAGNKGLDLLDGEVVYSAAEENYAAYLEMMNQFYTDGILHPDYYTLDSAALKPLVEGGETSLLVGAPPYVLMQQGWDKFEAITPLTSAQNKTQQYGVGFTTMLGNWVVNAETEYAAEIMRLSDYTFTYEFAAYVTYGPKESDDATYGMFEKGWVMDDNYQLHYGDLDGKVAWNEAYPNMTTSLGANPSVGIEGNYRVAEGYTTFAICWYLQTGEWVKVPYDLTNGDDHYRYTSIKNVGKYATPSLPTGAFYFDEETSVRISDISALIGTYTATEEAKFITGTRPLSEIPTFQQELEDLGVEELVGYYAEAYENYTETYEEYLKNMGMG
ncbi:MAG: extracellular solute-binding protein [Clostridiales bacterium]|nr:extracellular solute-binding protein [Clostridiales bacterium]